MTPPALEIRYICSRCDEDLTAEVNAAFETPPIPIVAFVSEPRGRAPERVTVRCSNNHMSLFTRAAEPGRYLGAVVSPANVAIFDSLKSLVDPGASLTRLDSFGKWLFSIGSFVGVLGGALGGVSLAGLQGTGRHVFYGAVLLVGVSLFLVVWGLTPIERFANPNNADQMAGALYKMIRKRSALLRISGILFAVALLFGSFAPLLTPGLGPRVDVGYTILKDSLFAEIGGRGLAPGAAVAAALHFSDPDPRTLVVQGRQVAGDSGRLLLKVAAPIPRTSLRASILVTCPDRSGGCVPSSLEVPIRKATPPGVRGRRQ